jgi:HNH endonuclease
MGLKLIAKGIIEPGTIDELKEIFNRFENILSFEAQELKPLKEERKLLRRKEQDAKKAYLKIWNAIKGKKDKESNNSLRNADKQIHAIRRELSFLNQGSREIINKNKGTFEPIKKLNTIQVRDKGILGYLELYSSYKFLNFFEKQEKEPVIIFKKGDGEYLLFHNNLYFFDSDDPHSLDEKKLLIKENYFRHEKKFRKLQKEIRLYEKMESKNELLSEPISEEVKFIVWKRDKGKCVKCGSNNKLEFNHIIPFSKGGSNTERNIQILCEKCNSEKADKI